MPDDLRLGKLLAKTRVRKGYSLEFIHSKLKIPVSSLCALEEDNYDFFPARIYMEGFLKEYIKFLELDKDPKVKSLTDSIKNNIKKQKKNPVEPEAVQRGLFDSIKPVYFKFALVVFVVLVFLTIWLYNNSSYIKWNVDKAKKPTYSSYYESSFISKLKINFKDKVWIKIKSDEKTLFEGFVPKDKTQIWQAHRNFTIETDNPKAFTLVLDNRKISPEIKKAKKTLIPVTFSGSYD